MDAISDDADVSQVIEISNGSPSLLMGTLPPFEQQLVADFITADQVTGPQSTATVMLTACCAGIRAVELPGELAGTNAIGWKKFITYTTALSAHFLSEAHREPAAAAVDGWVLETFDMIGVRPDGFAAELGRLYSATLGLPDAGVVSDLRTGQFVSRGGNDGRSLAGL